MSRRPATHWSFASRDRLRVELYVDARNATEQRALWEHFVAARDEIEARFGRSLAWEELPDSRASRIAHYFPGAATVAAEEQWPEYGRWLLEITPPFHEAFVDAIASLSTGS